AVPESAHEQTSRIIREGREPDEGDASGAGHIRQGLCASCWYLHAGSDLTARAQVTDELGTFALGGSAAGRLGTSGILRTGGTRHGGLQGGDVVSMQRQFRCPFAWWVGAA